jgi:hypothetical protein
VSVDLSVNGGTSVSTAPTARLMWFPICPDSLRIEDLGEADDLRGRAVRLFFRALRLVPGWF